MTDPPFSTQAPRERPIRLGLGVTDAMHQQLQRLVIELRCDQAELFRGLLIEAFDDAQLQERVRLRIQRDRAVAR